MLVLQKLNFKVLKLNWQFQKREELELETTFQMNGHIDLVGSGITIRILKVPGSSLLGNQAGLGTLPRYKAPGDFQVKNVKMQLLKSGE